MQAPAALARPGKRWESHPEARPVSRRQAVRPRGDLTGCQLPTCDQELLLVPSLLYLASWFLIASSTASAKAFWSP